MVTPVETLQHPWEHERMVELYARLAPKRVLEIGAWEGGTLWHWLLNPPMPGALGPPRKTVVVIDDEMRREREWREWAGAEIDFNLLRGKSQEPWIVEAASDLGPYDWIFIDADHRYEAGKADWENYSPMVAPGGCVIFHDVRRYEHGDLDRLWEEIKVGRRTMEIHDRTSWAWGGIGVVWV